MAKDDIIVRFVSNDKGNKAILEQNGKENRLSQTEVLKFLHESVGKGDFISGNIRYKLNGDVRHKYTLIVGEDKGNLVVITNPRYFDEDDKNIEELKKISQRGNSIKYWNVTKNIAACTLAAGVTIGSMALIIDKIIEKDNEEFRNENEYVDEFYKNEHGVDVRELPSYNERGGHFENNRFYHSKDGKIYFIRDDGSYMEITQEDYANHIAPEEENLYGNNIEEKGKKY